MELSNTKERKEWLVLYPAGILLAQLFFPKGVSLFIVGWALHLLALALKKEPQFFSITWLRPVLIVPLLYWVLHLLGLLYSDDLQFGLRDIETKFSFLILPCFFLLSAPYMNLRLLKQFFIGLVTLSLLVCWWLSLMDFWNEVYARNHHITLETYPFYNFFFSSYLSHFLHPGYYSMFILVAVYFLMTEIKAGKSLAERVPLIYLFLFLMVSLVFLSSKSGLIVALLSVVIALLSNQKMKVKEMVYGFVLLVILVGFSFSLPWVRNSFKEAFSSVNSPISPTEEPSSSSLRLTSWKTALQLWQKNILLGCGTGDVKNEMILLYKQDGKNLSAERKLNAHSQVLQGAAALGIAGLLLTLALLFVPLWESKSGGKLITLLLLIYGFTESIFETQAGVIFYTLVVPWLLASRTNAKTV